MHRASLLFLTRPRKNPELIWVRSGLERVHLAQSTPARLRRKDWIGGLKTPQVVTVSEYHLIKMEHCFFQSRLNKHYGWQIHEGWFTECIDWSVNSTVLDGKDESSKQRDSDSEEEQPKPKIASSPSTLSQRVPMFPGLKHADLMVSPLSGESQLEYHVFYFSLNLK